MEHLKKDETPKAEKKRRWPVVLLIILIIITIILGGSALAIYLSIGDMTPEQTPTIADAEPAERDSEVLDSYTVRYNDKLYRYNDQIVTLLLLGVDRDTPNITEGSLDSDVYADVVLLAAIDMKNNKVSFYTISRDTMCDFAIPDTQTGGTVNVNGQLALTFSYGDGGKTSWRDDPALLRAFEARIARGVALFRDDDADGELDIDPIELARGVE